MEYFITCSLVILFLLGVLYFYLYYKYKKTPNVAVYSHDEDDCSTTKNSIKDKAIIQKILFKRISFFAILISTSITFCIGIFVLLGFINITIDVDSIPKAASLFGGGALTAGLYRLYVRCEKDLNSSLH